MSNKRSPKKSSADLDPVRAQLAEMAAGAVVKELCPLELPKLGLLIHLASPGRVESLAIGSYVSVGGDQGDVGARGFVGMVRWMVVDDKGRPYFESYQGAANFLAKLDEADFEVLTEMLQELGPKPDEEEDDEDVDADVPLPGGS